MQGRRFYFYKIISTVFANYFGFSLDLESNPKEPEQDSVSIKSTKLVYKYKKPAIAFCTTAQVCWNF